MVCLRNISLDTLHKGDIEDDDDDDDNNNNNNFLTILIIFFVFKISLLCIRFLYVFVGCYLFSLCSSAVSVVGLRFVVQAR
jgi:hypothetical protein